MNELMVKEDVSSKIIEIRGMNVILDRDIAKILGMETKRINEVTKRNITMFNKNNYFQLYKDEFATLRSQIVTSNDYQRSQIATSKGGIRYLPYAFTKEGILILTSILKLKNDVITELINAFDRQNFSYQNDDNISEMIYEIREKQVILDFDLAKLYQVETKRINEAVRNNLSKFPLRYCFQITLQELNNICLRSKISTSNEGRGGRRYLPYAFTEQGVLMMATILKSQVAIDASLKIVDTFVNMKKYISYVSLPSNNITNLVLEDHHKIEENTKSISLLEKALDELKDKKVLTNIYYKGQIYDAYSKVLNIFKSAKKNLIVIDSYADINLLNIISNLNIQVVLITTRKQLSDIDVEKYNEQYHNLKVIYNNSFHDRFFIIDKNILYHCGASINKLGASTFAINNVSDEKIIDFFYKEIKKLINESEK